MRSLTIRDPEAFVAGLRRVVRVASKDRTRPTLCAVLLEWDGRRSHLVATDTHRLSAQEVDVDWCGDFGPLLFERGELAQVLRRKCAELLRIDVKGLTARFVMAGAGRNVPLVEGSFPDWAKVVPKRFAGSVRLRVRESLDAIKRIVEEADDEVRKFVLPCVRLNLTTGDWSLEGCDLSRTTDPPSTVFLNHEYVTDFLKSFGEGTVLVRRGEGLYPPVVVTGRAAPGFRHALMQMSG